MLYIIFFNISFSYCFHLQCLLGLGYFYSNSDECIEFEEKYDVNSQKCNEIEVDMVQNVNGTKRSYSELLMGEQIISEYQKVKSGQGMSHLTFLQYSNMDCAEKSRIHNRVWQWALKARSLLPNDQGLFCLILLHLMKNAHQYFNMDNPSDFQNKILEDKHLSETTRQEIIDTYKKANKKMHEVRSFKSKNHINEQKE